MRTTWFAVDRDIQNHWVWQDKPFAYGQAWIDLLLLARYADGKTLFKGALQERKAGTAYVSVPFLADRWGWSKGKTRRFLNLLEKDNCIQKNGTADGTAVTIVKWGIYQNLGHTDGSAGGTADGSADGSADGTQKYKVNNIYKENNDLYSIKGKFDDDICKPEARERLQEMRARIKRVNDEWRTKHE